MGMDAELLAVGPFKKGLVHYLDYPKDYYSGVAEGERIITKVLTCGGTTKSTALALMLGVRPWDFGHHCIGNKFPFRKDDIDDFCENTSYEPGELTKQLVSLYEAGFEFFYLPNG